MNFSKRSLKAKGELIIGLSFIVFALGEAGRVVFSPNVDPYQVVYNEVTFEWFCRVLRDAGLTLALVGMVVLGILTLRKEGFSFKMFLCAFVGFAFLAGLSVFAFSSSSKMHEISTAITKPTIPVERFKSKINDASIPLEDRVMYSEALAQMMYSEEGVLLEKLNPDGSTSIYEPPAEDVKMREETLKANQVMEWLKEAFWRKGIYWSVVAVASVLLGFLPFKRVCS